MSINFPAPDALDDYLLNASSPGEQSGDNNRRDSLKLENAIAARFWGGIQWRIVVTFSVCAVLWSSILVLGLNGTIPLWIGLILNTVLDESDP